MPSKAWQVLRRSQDDIIRLLEIHRTIAGDKAGRKYRLEVLNKSAIVLITAIWEAYCEDLASEMLEHIVKHAKSPEALPKGLRKSIAEELKCEKHELAVWKLAGHGWQEVLKARLSELTEERNRSMNTPKAANIVDLFRKAVGLHDVSEEWHWRSMSVEQAKVKLDKYIKLRGAIAHRGKAAESCTKADVTDYFRHIKRLASNTSIGAWLHVHKVCGKGLWPLRAKPRGRNR